MMNTILRPTPIVAAMFVLQANAASGVTINHTNPPSRLTIEHAEILVRDGAASLGYLTIWNGTTVQTSLISVRSDDFAKVRILRGIKKLSPENDIFPIPGHAELKMTDDGIRLELAGPSAAIADGKRSDLTLVFGNGTTMKVDATILPSRDLLTDHHHGEEDRRPD